MYFALFTASFRKKFTPPLGEGYPPLCVSYMVEGVFHTFIYESA